MKNLKNENKDHKDVINYITANKHVEYQNDFNELCDYADRYLSEYGTDEEIDSVEDSKNTLQELLDKEKPMELIKKKELIDDCLGYIDFVYRCANCNERMNYIMVYDEGKYCPNCGQRLDWKNKF